MPALVWLLSKVNLKPLSPYCAAVKSIFLSEPFDAEDGQYSLTSKPGLGIDVDENKLEKYRIKPSL